MTMKICKKCGKEKAESDFSRDAKARDGLFGACKECEKIRRAAWTENNRERISDTSRKYNAEHKEEISAYNKERYQKNHDYHIQRKRRYTINARETISQKKHEYYIKNRERELERCRAWARANPEKARQKTMRRVAIKRKATIGKVDYSEILKRDGYICHICGGVVDPGDLHFDHVMPLSRGGSHSMDNIKVSHAHCNLVKFNKLIS